MDILSGKIEVVFPASEELEANLRNLKTTYYKCETSLTNFIDFVTSTGGLDEGNDTMIALGSPSHLDNDVWCIGSTSLLVLSVGKETYEQLQLTSSFKFPWKGYDNLRYIMYNINDKLPLWNLKKKEKESIKAWDQRRGPWNITYHYDDIKATNIQHIPGAQKFEVVPEVRQTADVRIVDGFSVKKRPERDNEDQVRDWEEECSELFEWVGMACLGSDRLRTNDKPDPYLAVYDPSLHMRAGRLTHIKWTGLLSSTFTKQVLDCLLDVPFACVVAHGVPTSPVGFSKEMLTQPSIRVPRPDSEDTWSIVLTSEGNDSENGKWIMAETIGEFDARWG
ncbi:Ribonuclease P protein subunit Rpp40 [Abortiporus biennis]